MFITIVITDGEKYEETIWDLIQNAQGRSIFRKSIKHGKNQKTVTYELKGPAYRGAFPPKFRPKPHSNTYFTEGTFIKCVIKVKWVFYDSGRKQQQITLQVLLSFKQEKWEVYVRMS